jgi:hypothetical protein
MIIRYADGRNSEAVLLSRTSKTMRVVLTGADDATDLTETNGTWFSDDFEPVQVEFVWQSRPHTAVPSVSDSVCSPELASMMIDLLFACSREAQSEATTAFQGRRTGAVRSSETFYAGGSD